MTTAEFKAEILTTYPPILTLENVRVILRISKRKASWMLKNGYIKCKDSGKKTRQFQIDVNDLLDYIRRVEEDDISVRVPTGLFNGKPAATHHEDAIIAPKIIHESPPDDFCDWLADEWCDENEMLTTEEIALLTGYRQQTVQEWQKEKKLKSVFAQTKLVITKQWVIDFYTTYGYQIQNKSNKHILLLLKYYQSEN